MWSLLQSSFAYTFLPHTHNNNEHHLQPNHSRGEYSAFDHTADSHNSNLIKFQAFLRKAEEPKPSIHAMRYKVGKNASPEPFAKKIGIAMPPSSALLGRDPRIFTTSKKAPRLIRIRRQWSLRAAPPRSTLRAPIRSWFPTSATCSGSWPGSSSSRSHSLPPPSPGGCTIGAGRPSGGLRPCRFSPSP